MDRRLFQLQFLFQLHVKETSHALVLRGKLFFDLLHLGVQLLEVGVEGGVDDVFVTVRPLQIYGGFGELAELEQPTVVFLAISRSTANGYLELGRVDALQKVGVGAVLQRRHQVRQFDDDLVHTNHVLKGLAGAMACPHLNRSRSIAEPFGQAM